jgi:hypothetical protein
MRLLSRFNNPRRLPERHFPSLPSGNDWSIQQKCYNNYSLTLNNLSKLKMLANFDSACLPIRKDRDVWTGFEAAAAK